MKTKLENLTQEQLETIVELFGPSMDDYLYVCDFKEDYYRISPRATRRFQLSADRFHNVLEEHKKFVYTDDVDMLVAELELLKAGKKDVHNLHYRWLGRDGEPIWINCRGLVIKDENGDPHFLVGCINEIGEKQKADNVSGLLGEFSMRTYLEKYEGKLPAGYVLRLGIDDFKNINESHGIEYGDYVLRRTAEIIAEHSTTEQQLFRIVADEFVIVDESGGGIAEAKHIYHAIRAALDAFIEEEHYKAVYTISGGILENAQSDGSFENVMQLSEFALSEAKRMGKNRCQVFCQEDYDAYQQKRQKLRMLHHAVDQNFEGFETYFQPLVDAADGKLSGAETLLRFHTPDGKMLSPAEFIPILEESGLIIPVGKWVLKQALDACREWQQYMPEFKVNVNLSYVQVLKSQVLCDVRNIVEASGVAPSSVCIELTESGYLEENSHFAKIWKGLKEYGILLALDDFGTGYSNLHCLSDLQPACVKIDRSFMIKALSYEYEYQLLNHIVEMSHSLGLAVCVEGIETEGELTRAKGAEPDYIQGYLFGKPVARTTFFEQFFA